MKIGQIDQKNAEFINDYKAMGYSSKTQLANDAIRALRLKTKRRLRKKWLADAFAELAKTSPDRAAAPPSQA